MSTEADEIYEPEDDFNESFNDDETFDVDEDTISEPEDGFDLEDTRPNAGLVNITSAPESSFSITHEEGTTVRVVHLEGESEQSQVIDLASPPLSEDEAKHLTSSIRTQSNVLYLLIARAHAGKAHLALGYTSFEAYVKEEFNYSKSYAYKLINQANVIEAIQEVMPEGAQVYVSDATARGLKTSLGEFIPELEQRLEDNDDTTDANEVVEDLIQEYRDRRNEAAAETGNDDDYDTDFGGEYPTGSGGGNDEDFEYSFDEDEDFEEDGDDDEFGDKVAFRRRIEAVYNLYTTLAQFSQMPPSDEIISVIPVERRPQVTAYLETALEWLNSFKTTWDEAIANDESDENDDSDLTEDEDY